MPTVYTLGYEGFTVTNFLMMLERETVALVVDTRQNPRSRKKGFSKRPLSELLASVRIDYLHLPELGSPADVRHAYKISGDWDRFRVSYELWITQHSATVDMLRELMKTQTIGILCYEADVDRCHRSLLARQLLTSCRDYTWIDLSRNGKRTQESWSWLNPTRVQV